MARNVQSQNLHSLVIAAVLLIALAARIARAVTEPVVNADVIRFIEQGRQIFEHPLDAMRGESYHPLHAVLGRVVHDLVTSHLIADDRFAWIAALKVVGIAASLVVTWLLMRVARHFGAPWWAAAGAGLLWAIGRRTSTYGADGMSDCLFLALFGAAMLAAISARLRPGFWRWLLIGALAGLSYLTRPEGAAVILILSLTLVVMAIRHRLRAAEVSALGCGPARFAPLQSTLFMLLGFLVVGGPYMLIIGRFTGKKELTFAAAHALPLAQIQLAPIFELETWHRIGMEIMETFGWAPCIVVGLAMLLKPRLWGRLHWRPLVLIWSFLWLAVMVWLIDRTRTAQSSAGYLDGRHTLVLQFVLHCLFALALAVWLRPMRWYQNYYRAKPVWAAMPRWRKWPGWPGVFSAGVLCLTCLPGIILLREPPSEDRVYLRDAAAWIQQHAATDAVIAFHEPTLSFYSNRQYYPWFGASTEIEVEHQRRTNPFANKLIIACVFQLERGEVPTDRFGECTAVAKFDSPESLHHDVLVIYLPDDSHALPILLSPMSFPAPLKSTPTTNP